VGRLLALDVGSKRIGVALSDELGILASPHSTIQRQSANRDIAAVLALVRDLTVDRIIVGLPVGSTGQATEQTRYSERFAERLASRSPVAVEMWDEGHTSWAARQIVGSSPSVRRSGRIDAVAAALILQSYLDYRPDGRTELTSRQDGEGVES
jgi:putative Holliday junction resolvase